MVLLPPSFVYLYLHVHFSVRFISSVSFALCLVLHEHSTSGNRTGLHRNWYLAFYICTLFLIFTPMHSFPLMDPGIEFIHHGIDRIL